MNSLGPVPSNTSEIKFTPDCFKSVDGPSTWTVGCLGAHGMFIGHTCDVFSTLEQAEASHKARCALCPGRRYGIRENKSTKIVRVKWN